MKVVFKLAKSVLVILVLLIMINCKNTTDGNLVTKYEYNCVGEANYEPSIELLKTANDIRYGKRHDSLKYEVKNGILYTKLLVGVNAHNRFYPYANMVSDTIFISLNGRLPALGEKAVDTEYELCKMLFTLEITLPDSLSNKYQDKKYILSLRQLYEKPM